MKADVYWIPGPWAGRLAILARPRRGDWLSDEVESWRNLGVQAVVSLLVEDEIVELGLTDERSVVERSGLRFISFPINDYDVPSSKDELRQLVDELDALLSRGQTVGIHCRAGIGRSSLVAACLLANHGEEVEGSFERISKSRGVSVPDTPAQREWVGDFVRASLSTSQHVS